jgi:outer membrane cobalamin receptor
VARIFGCIVVAMGIATAAVVDIAAAEPAGPGDNRTAPYQLGAVVVTAPAGDVQAGQSTITIPAAEIEARGARTLDETFGSTPGIDIRSGGGGIPRIFLRGLPPRHTPLFLNGVPLNSAADGQFDPRLIPVENIAEIKLIEGNSSVLYGPGTTAGVIDIITKKGLDGLHGDARGEWARGNAWLGTADASGAYGTSNFFLSGSRQESPAFYLADGSRRPNSDEHRTNLFGNLGSSTGDWTVGISGSYLSARQGIPFQTINDPVNPFLKQQQFERLDSISGASGQLDIHYDPKGPGSARLSLYVNQLNEIDDRFDNAKFNSMVDPTVQTFHQIPETLVSGARSFITYDLQSLGLLASSLAVERNAETLGGFIRDVPLASAAGGGGGGGGRRGGGGGGAATPTFGFRVLNLDQALDTYSAALEYNVSPLPRTHFTLGYSRHWFVQDQDDVHAEHQWMTGIAYDVFETLKVDASYGRKVRFPTLQELFDAAKGNPNLVPEQSEDYEANVTWKMAPATTLQLTGFHNRVNNFIQNDNVTQKFTNRDTLIQGTQLALKTQLDPSFLLTGGYTYLDTRDETNDTRVDFRPRHVVSLEGDYWPTPEWQVHALLSVVMDQVVTANNNPFRQQHLPDYGLINLRVARYFPAYGLKIYAGADNLTNTRYEFAPGFPAAGATYLVGAQFSF